MIKTRVTWRREVTHCQVEKSGRKKSTPQSQKEQEDAWDVLGESGKVNSLYKARRRWKVVLQILHAQREEKEEEKKKKRECKTSITKASPNSNSTVLFSVDFQNTVLTGTNKNRNIAGDHGEQSN